MKYLETNVTGNLIILLTESELDQVFKNDACNNVSSFVVINVIITHVPSRWLQKELRANVLRLVQWCMCCNRNENCFLVDLTFFS